MVSWLPHAVVPGLVALAFFPMERRRILWMLPIAWLPDLDYLVPEEHRAVTTNIWIPLCLMVALWVMWRRTDPVARFWEYATRPGHPGHVLLAAYYWSSHILMDVFAGGAVLFWPLWDVNVYWFYEIVVDTRTNQFTDTVDVGTEPGAPALTEVFVWFSAEHNAILWFLIACGAVGGLLAWRRWRHRPVVVERPATLA